MRNFFLFHTIFPNPPFLTYIIVIYYVLYRKECYFHLPRGIMIFIKYLLHPNPPDFRVYIFINTYYNDEKE